MNTCCFCGKPNELYGDLVIKNGLYFERYYHRKCKKVDEAYWKNPNFTPFFGEVRL